ncbi:MAG: hypothetical protein ACLSUT_03345 [Christensenellales bacterium]
MKPEYDLNKTLEYERFFSAEHSESFVLLPGAGSVMLSAPHSVTQTRLGKIKIAEKMTGVLALLVRDATGCPVIFKTKNAGDDAGFDRDSDYKRAAEKYVEENGIRLLLDLHQLSDKRKYAVDIGTGRGNNVLSGFYTEAAVKAFESKGIAPIGVDALFPAVKKDRTVSAFVAARQPCSCLQLELNSGILHAEDASFRLVLEAICEIVESAVRRDR